MKIRQLANEERPVTTWPLQGYAFEPSPMAAADAEKLRDHLPYHRQNVTLVVEEDGGETLAAVSAFPMRQNVRGTVLPMAGVSGVATHPLARRQGHVRTLLTQLLGEMRDEGYAVSALYPFRSSFYARFGFAGLPKPRTVSFSPADLGGLLNADLPGELRWQRVRDGYDAYRGLTERLLGSRHGFSLAPDYQAVRLRDRDDRWLASAWLDGEMIGAVTYRIDEHGGTLTGDDLLTVGPLGRALLLQFFARHVDQVARVSMVVPADETPELWATDLAVQTESRIAFPSSVAPMARVLSLDALDGLASGPGRVRVEIVDDPFTAGDYLLDGGSPGSGGGRLEVSRAAGGAVPTATLTAAGISALVYGVLDPEEVPLRGLGTVPADAAVELRSLFPRAMPYLFVDF
ncbi:putative acetyltransferase [Micromonospora pisi]|uniref:Putative acetyltransferase n=1 Tax=Micromonospora pisi TaxID=589240 RepID=A0A495JPT3_9ACTN|nr:GNAT family N-acetyltransferase [Micromonospora pisi]RKR90973.1 putative acetyltransferase [Micromonospora pisi]